MIKPVSKASAPRGPNLVAGDFAHSSIDGATYYGVVCDRNSGKGICTIRD